MEPLTREQIDWVGRSTHDAVRDALAQHAKSVAVTPAAVTPELMRALAQVTKEHVKKEIASALGNADSRVTRGLTRPELEAVVSGISEGLRDKVQSLLDDLADRVRAFDGRIAALEAKPTVRYAGIHQQGERYRAGALCTRGGGLWLCQAADDTLATPGDGSGDWQLVVKQNRA